MKNPNLVWLIYSFIATLSIVPAFLSIPYFAKNHGMKPEVFMSWYFAAVSIGVASWLTIVGRSAQLFPSSKAIVGAILIGLIFGSPANSFLFKAVALAPNPGLPPAIYSSASIIVFVLAAIFAVRFPQYFIKVTVAPDRLIGILIVTVGLFLAAGGWPFLRKLLPSS